MAGAKVLIDRDKAQAVLQNMAEHLMEAGNPEMAGAVGYAAEVVSKQKAANAVEVVRCKNCIMCTEIGLPRCRLTGRHVTDSDFCSRGERREEE